QVELDSLCLEQRRVLLRQRVFRLSEYPDEIFHAERLQFHANGKTPLQLGNHVARLRHVKRSGGNKEDMVRAQEPVTSVDGRTFDNRKNVALHAFAAYVRSVSALAAGDLVDFIQEDNAVRFHAIERYAG